MSQYWLLIILLHLICRAKHARAQTALPLNTQLLSSHSADSSYYTHFSLFTDAALLQVYIHIFLYRDHLRPIDLVHGTSVPLSMRSERSNLITKEIDLLK